MKRDDFRFVHTLRARYAETDMQGVVFYGNYTVYYDTAITEYLRWLGWDYQDYVKRTGNDFHIVKSTLEYLDSATFDDWLDVCVRTGRVGTSSIAFDLAIFANGDGQRAINRGEIIWVNTDQQSRKSTPVDEALVSIVRRKDPVPA